MGTSRKSDSPWGGLQASGVILLLVLSFLIYNEVSNRYGKFCHHVLLHFEGLCLLKPQAKINPSKVASCADEENQKHI